jgi:hypothetical protein
MRRLGILLAALAALALPLALNRPATAQNGNGWGDIKGRVVWGKPGPIPVPTPIAAVGTSADKAHCLANGPVLTEDWVINPKNKGIRWTFVWLINQNPKDKTPLPINPKLPAPKPAETMDQPMCAFVPHALALRQGQVLVAKNSSPVAHNFKWTGNQLTKNAGGNVQIPGGGQFQIKGLEADRLPIQVECNIHPWMTGWVRVFDHPYYAVTDADGNFTIKGAPAGNYRLMVWNENGYLGGKAGREGMPIEIKAGGTTDTGELTWK